MIHLKMKLEPKLLRVYQHFNKEEIPNNLNARVIIAIKHPAIKRQ